MEDFLRDSIENSEEVSIVRDSSISLSFLEIA